MLLTAAAPAAQLLAASGAGGALPALACGALSRGLLTLRRPRPCRAALHASAASPASATALRAEETAEDDADAPTTQHHHHHHHHHDQAARIPSALDIIADARRRAADASAAARAPIPSSPSSFAAAALLDGRAVAAHPPWHTRAALETVVPEHLPPSTLRQRLTHRLILAVRAGFDRATGYSENAALSERAWIARCLFLEAVAGVPGMVGGALRHLKSLRLLKADGGRIATLIEESENERMHLLTFLELRKPGRLFRASVTLAQGVAWNAYFLTYLVAPRACHAFVGYLEEQAVRTYTHLLAEIDAGRVFKDAPAPEVARLYWRLPRGATLRDVVLAIRADEKAHAEVNHTLSLIADDAPNPFAPPIAGGEGAGGGACSGGGPCARAGGAAAAAPREACA